MLEQGTEQTQCSPNVTHSACRFPSKHDCHSPRERNVQVTASACQLCCTPSLYIIVYQLGSSSMRLHSTDNNAVPIIWSLAYLHGNLLLILLFHNKYWRKPVQFLSHITTSVEISCHCKVGFLLMCAKVSIKPNGDKLESQLDFVKCFES